jgi:hypothetical protein
MLLLNRLSFASLDRQTGHLQAIMGTPPLVPVPKNSTVIDKMKKIDESQHYAAWESNAVPAVTSSNIFLLSSVSWSTFTCSVAIKSIKVLILPSV